MTYWEELNNYQEPLSDFGLIPNGTLAKVRMTIKPGNYNDQTKGWTDDYVTKKNSTGSIYLDAEFIVLEGQYAKRKVWSKIGLHGIKGPEWENMGKGFIKSIINSARGLSSKDNTDIAVMARSINSFASLDGIEFVARIDLIAEKNGDIVKYKNEIKTAITLDHKDYAAVKNGNASQTQHTQPTNNNSNRSNWA